MPKTQIVSYSEIDCARQCLHKHQLAYKERWVAPTLSAPLARGSLWHAVMQQHYGTILIAQQSGLKRPTASELAIAVGPLLEPEVGQPSEVQELIRWMYEGYVEQYGTDEQWFIVAVEHPVEFWLPSVMGGRSRFKLKMRIDLVVKENKRLIVVDHKSCKDLPKQKMLEIDDQFGLYTWGLRQMGKQVHQAVHNAARTQRNKGPMQLEDRFSRTPMYRTEEELDRIAIEAGMTARRAYLTDNQERSPDPDRCGWRCDYTEACLFGRKKDDAHERDFLRSSGYRQDFTRH